MIACQGDRLCVTVPMVMGNAAQLLAEGRALLGGGQSVVDLSAVEEADSSAVAVMLGWVRAAQGRGLPLSFAGVPSGVRSLADLYGVADLIPRS